MEDFNWELFEQDQSDFDKLMERAAYENTYLILTGKATWESILEKQSMQSGSIDQFVKTAILFDPMGDDYSPKFPHLHNDIDRNDLIDSMLEYYILTEEYEKCAELTNYRKKIC